MTPKAVEFESAGFKLKGLLHLPSNASASPSTSSGPSAFPAFACIHGLTLNHHMFENLAGMAQAAGIACLRFHLRGHGDSQGALEAQGFEDEIADLRAAMAFLRSSPEVDGKHLGLLGFSIGGAVAAVAARRDGAIKALATWGSLWDTRRWTELRYEQYGRPEGGVVKIWDEIGVSGRLFSEAIAADPFADALAFPGPFFAAHGGKDQNHPPEKSRELVARRGQMGLPAEGFFPGNSGHKFRLKADWEALNQKTLSFFRAGL